MSKARTEMKHALRSLDVSKPLRIPPQLGFSAPQTTVASRVASGSTERLISKTGSNLDPVRNEQSQILTGSKFDPVKNQPGNRENMDDFVSNNEPETGSRSDRVNSSPGQNLTGSEFNPVKNRPGEKRTGSKFDPVVSEDSSPATKSLRGFTRVPNVILRGVQPFRDPVDFMIYLHLFTYSYGFERSTASMSLGQLERFTGAVRNTVRKSIERLTQQGWIECVEEFESARLSRKWRVRHPENGGPEDLSNRTGLKSDPVAIEPGQCLTPSGSKSDPVTGSKIDPFLESSSKERSKNSLSRVSAREESRSDQVGGLGDVLTEPVLRDYFGRATLTQRKRQSELAAFRELRECYSEQSIAQCVEYLGAKGLPSSGEPCHSPMAFLSRAMGEVLVVASEWSRKRSELAQRDRVEGEREQDSVAQAEREEAEYRAKEQVFVRAFPDAEAQEREIARLAAGLSPFIKDPAVVRRIVIGGWGERSKSQAGDDSL